MPKEAADLVDISPTAAQELAERRSQCACVAKRASMQRKCDNHCNGKAVTATHSVQVLNNFERFEPFVGCGVTPDRLLYGL
jgi:hypothetical protein